MARFDIVTLGSAVSDVFVKTPEQSTRVVKDHGHLDVCFHIGSKMLIDDIHFETGGAGTNTAAAFARLGLKTGFVGKLGVDRNSEHMLEYLKDEGITFLGAQGEGLMGFSVIMVGLENDRTILTYKGLNNDLHTYDVKASARKTSRYYFSSMLGTSWKTQLHFAKFARKEHIPYSFNPSLYIARLGIRTLKPLVSGCDLLTLNKEEAEALTNSRTGTAMNDLLLKLHKYASLSCITDGSRGAFAYDGHFKYSITPPRIRTVETTGAGDAFASGFTAGRHWHMDVDDCLKLGMVESASVIQHIGAKNKLLAKPEAIAALSSPRYRVLREII